MILVLSFLLPVIGFVINFLLNLSLTALTLALNSLEVTLCNMLATEESERKGLSDTTVTKKIAKVGKRVGKLFKGTKRTAKTAGTVAGGTAKVSILAVKASIKAIKLSIRFIKMILNLIKVLVATLESLTVTGIVTVILIVTMLACTVAMLLTVLDDDFGVFGGDTVVVQESTVSSTQTQALSKWIDSIKLAKKLYAKTSAKYTPPYKCGSPNNTMDITLSDGTKVTCRRDCSGLVCMSLHLFDSKFGAMESGSSDFGSTSSSIGKKLIKAGFTHKKFDVSKLVEGTIIVQPGTHVEIFSHFDGEAEFDNIMVWNAGSDKSITDPNQTHTATGSYKHNYTDMWLPPVETVMVDAGITVSSAAKGEWQQIYQSGESWSSIKYGYSTVGGAGCGACALTMIYRWWTGDDVWTPTKVANWIMDNYGDSGCTNQDNASIGNFLKDNYIGLKEEYHASSSVDLDKLDAVLGKGGVVLFVASKGDYTDGGHYVVIIGGNRKSGYNTVDSSHRFKGIRTGVSGSVFVNQCKRWWEILPKGTK